MTEIVLPWQKYDRGLGGIPKLDDEVIICHTCSSLDDVTGSIGGWGDPYRQIAVIILDVRRNTGERTITVPVVCLKPKTE